MEQWITFFETAGAFCLWYYLFIMIYVGWTSFFHYIWLAAGIIFRCAAILLKNGIWLMIPGFIRWGILIFIFLGLLIFFAMEVLIFSKMWVKPQPNVHYMIVLGACIRGTRVTSSLSYRLKKAAAYAKKHPECMLVVSGGQGPGEDVTEAKAMSDYLHDRLGIDKERILQEDRSTTTKENLQFSKAIIERYERITCSETKYDKTKYEHDNCQQMEWKQPEDERVQRSTGLKTEQLHIAVCSNNFHMYRAIRLAKAAGDWKVSGLAAITDPFMWLSFTVREGLALFKEMILRNI